MLSWQDLQQGHGGRGGVATTMEYSSWPLGGPSPCLCPTSVKPMSASPICTEEGDRIGAKHIRTTSSPVDMVGTVSLVSTQRVCFSRVLLFTQPFIKAQELCSVSKNIL